MALSEYVLLVSLSAGIHAHADTGGIAIGPEAITQPNGGVTPVTFKVADKHKDITATSKHIWTGPAHPSPHRDLGTGVGGRSDWGQVPTRPTTAVPTTRPPTLTIPKVR
jgi:hypothetical protein